MKLVLLSLVLSVTALAEDTESLSVSSLPIVQYQAPELLHEEEFHSELLPAPDDGISLHLDHFQTPSLQQDQTPILTLTAATLRRVTAERYGITGEVINATSSIVSLWMYSSFVQRADAAPDFQTPNTTIFPSGSWQPFELQFDRGHSGLVLEGLNLVAIFNHPGTLKLRNMKLVQFSDAPTVTVPSPADHPRQMVLVVTNSNEVFLDGVGYGPNTIEQITSRYRIDPRVELIIRFEKNADTTLIHDIIESCRRAGFQRIRVEPEWFQPADASGSPRTFSFDWKAFFLGMLTTCLLLLATAGMRIALHRWNQIRHARELRRIASLDT